MTRLTDAERRVLAHLPPWRTKAQLERINAERDEPYPTDVDLPALTARLIQDEHALYARSDGSRGHLGRDPDALERTLSTLIKRGLAKAEGDRISMTKKGLGALMA